MKNKSSWEMTDKESLFNKQERIEIYQDYQKSHPKEKRSKLGFICGMCGKFHSWADIGKKH